MELKIINRENKVVIENFDEFKADIQNKLETEYKVPVITEKLDYIFCKDQRAKFNKIAETINDEKIAWTKEVVGEMQSQIKELCELFDAKSKEYDKVVKEYEYEVLGKERPKVELSKLTITIYEGDEFHLENIKSYCKENNLKITERRNADRESK